MASRPFTIALAFSAAGWLIVPDADAQRIRRDADTTPPVLTILTPVHGSRIETMTPDIEVGYEDAESGASVVTFRAFINDQDRSADFDHHSRGATGRIPSSRPLPLGENRLVIELADRAGNRARAESTFINAGGGWLTVTAPPGAGPTQYVELIVDASGSMSDALLDSTRMEIARGAIRNLVRGVPDGAPLGLRVFNGCDGIRSLIPVTPVDRPAFVRTVDQIHPGGGTPIVDSLLESFEALAAFTDGERVAVILTDGEETCGGNLGDVTERAQELRIRTIIIGFELEGGPRVYEQFRRLAASTGGAFHDARDAATLQAALERGILEIGYRVHDSAGNRVAGGVVNGDPLMLPVGTYTLRLDASSIDVETAVTIGPLEQVAMELRKGGFGRRAAANRQEER